MKKTRLLSGPVSALVARLGHGDSLCIGDAGLPIPNGVERIDLAVSRGIPGFVDTLEAVVSELMVEKVLIASELEASGGAVHGRLAAVIADLAYQQGFPIEIAVAPHEQLKSRTCRCKAVIRTGECTPYANIILSAGVVF